jgi:hypothetical protein
VLPIGGSGPPPIQAGKGREVLTQMEPFRLVSLDAAAFDWLWRVVENRALQHQEAAIQGGVHEIQAGVSLRAAIAFREAAGTLTKEANGQVKKPKRRLVKELPNP